MSEIKKQLNTEVQKLSIQAKSLYDSMKTKFELNGDKEYDGMAGDREQLAKMVDRGEELRKQLDDIRKIEQLIDPEVEDFDGKMGRMAQHAEQVLRRKSIGQQVIESAQFKEAKEGRAEHLSRVELKLGLEEGTNAQGGYLVFSDRDQRLRELPQQDTDFLDYVSFQTTTSNAVEIIQETTNTNNAAFVAEKALKPESDMQFGKIIIPILTLATWVTATRQILEDAPRLRSIIDGRLRIFCRRKLEDSVIKGAGGANNLDGITHVAGTQQRVHKIASNGMGAATDNMLDTLRYGITDLQLKFFRPSVIVFNPKVSALLETLKDSTGQYIMRYDPIQNRIWRIPSLVSTAMPDAEAVIYDKDMSFELYLRNEIQIFTGQPFKAVAADATTGIDYFLHNMFAVLAEMRVGLGYPYPEGIVEITALAP